MSVCCHIYAFIYDRGSCIIDNCWGHFGDIQIRITLNSITHFPRSAFHRMYLVSFSAVHYCTMTLNLHDVVHIQFSLVCIQCA